MRVLAKLDQFGIALQLRVFGKNKFTSTLGGLLTIVALAASAVIFYFMGTDLWNRHNPNLVPNEVTHEDAQNIDLSKGEYPFMIRLSFFDGFNTPNKGYKILAEYHDLEDNGTGGYNFVCNSFFNNLTNCNDHSVKKLDLYKDEDLSSWL